MLHHNTPPSRFARRALAAAIVATLAAPTALIASATASAPASAEVRLGNNVRIGGHDASNQTFDKNNRGEYHIYNSAPKKPGCHWRNNADGSRTKVCHLKRKVK